MKTKKVLIEKVVPIEVSGKSISELVAVMSETGFQGRKLAEACEVYVKMANEAGLTIFFGLSGALSVAGQWRLICWLIENRYIDVLVSTGANISEDIVNAMGFDYWKGDPGADDTSLFKGGLNRYYDIYGREDDYMKMTELIADFIVTLDETRKYSSREFLSLFGKWLSGKEIRSIVSVAAAYKVPVFCPAIVDSPYGDAALIAKSRGFDLTIDAVKDYVEFMGLSRQVKDTAVAYIGGGVPKDFIQLLAVTGNLLYTDRQVPGKKGGINRMANGEFEAYHPHKYAIQITTDSPQWGGLSGCTFEEAISWGKEKGEGSFAQCFCDATIALPILAHVLAERAEKARAGTEFSF